MKTSVMSVTETECAPVSPGALCYLMDWRQATKTPIVFSGNFLPLLKIETFVPPLGTMDKKMLALADDARRPTLFPTGLVETSLPFKESVILLFA